MRVIFNLFKVCLFAFNTFYFLLGLGLVIGSTFAYVNPNQLNSLIKLEYGREYANLVYGINAAGIFFILVGFVGSLAIVGEKSWLMFAYFCSLFAIFTLQFACSVIIYIQSADAYKALATRVLRSIRDDYGASGVHARALDYMQAEFLCCGWHSPKDWFASSYVDPKYTLRVQPSDLSHVITAGPTYLYKIPHSCCVNTYDLTCLIMNKFHEVGCERIIKHIYQTIELYLAWTLAFLNMFQLVVLVLTLYVLCMMFYADDEDDDGDGDDNKTEYEDDENTAYAYDCDDTKEQRWRRRRRSSNQQQNRILMQRWCLGSSSHRRHKEDDDDDNYDEVLPTRVRTCRSDPIYMTSYYL